MKCEKQLNAGRVYSIRDGISSVLAHELENIIPSDEPVRLLNAVLEEMDYRKLTVPYSRIGRIEYSPRLLFKVVLYGCCRGIYSPREIERACRENVNFMYLLEGHKAPDHNTILLPQVLTYLWTGQGMWFG